MENIADFAVRPLDFKGQSLDAKVKVEMNCWNAKGHLFKKEFRGHRDHMQWQDFLNSIAGSWF